jgi:hypothetical protein
LKNKHIQVQIERGRREKGLQALFLYASLYRLATCFVNCFTFSGDANAVIVKAPIAAARVVSIIRLIAIIFLYSSPPLQQNPKPQTIIKQFFKIQP